MTDARPMNESVARCELLTNLCAAEACYGGLTLDELGWGTRVPDEQVPAIVERLLALDHVRLVGDRFRTTPEGRLVAL